MTVIYESDRRTADALAAALPPGSSRADSAAAAAALLQRGPDLLVVGPGVDTGDALRLAQEQLAVHPHLGVVLVREDDDAALLRAAMRAGVREVVVLGEDDVTDACTRSLALTRSRAARPSVPDERPATQGVVVTVFAAKGGVGKTTVATNLAVALAGGAARRRVCLLDLDLAFGDVAIVLRLFPTRTLGDAVGLSRLDDEAVQSLVTRHDSGVDVLAAPVDPSTSEAVSAALVGDLLRVLVDVYDVVVVDTPPAFTEHTLAAFDRTDQFVLPATLDVPSVKNLKLTLETLDLLRYPAQARHVLLNRSDAKVALTVEDVEKTLQTSIAAQVPSSRAVPSSVNRGVPLVLDAPGHPASVVLTRFAETLAPRPAVAPALRADRRALGGLFRRAATS